MKNGLSSGNKSIEEIQLSYNDIYENTEEGLALPADSRKKILHMLKLKKNQRILDIGCGCGHLLYEAQQIGAIPFGIDISSKAIELAEKRLPDIEMHEAPAEKLPWPSGYFDCIANVGSLEHMLDMEASLMESARVLKKEGFAAFLVPNSFYLFHVLKAWLTGKEHVGEQWVERTGTIAGWTYLLEGNGFKVIDVEKYNLPPSMMPWWYHPVYHLITRNMSWCFIFLCKKAKQFGE